jgi:aryl-alcohol dehydrogenase-like predicted oxidoreductase
MNYRLFREHLISEIGLGTWQLGSADWGKVDEPSALEILQAFTDAGGNFIDTADVYGMGISETIIGKFLKQSSKELFVATKLGRKSDAGKPWPPVYSMDYMRRMVEDSLEHLGVDQLFLEQLHCIPPDEIRSGKVFDHFRKLQEEKLIRYWGASVETSEEALVCLEQEGLASLQIIFNMFRQHVAEEVFEKAAEKGVAIIVRVPLASGLLTGKFTADTKFEPNDHRNFNADGKSFNAGETFSGIQFSKGLQLVEEIKQLLPDDRLAQWAVRWILDHPQVTTVIPGASKIYQVRSNMEASSLPQLSPDVHSALRDLYDERIKPQIRGHY